MTSTRRRFGRAGRLRRRDRAGHDADRGRDVAPQQPRRAAGPVLRGRAVVRGPRAGGRPHPVAGAERHLRRARALRPRWAVALMVVPGIAAAYLWVAPRGPASPRIAPAAGRRRRRMAVVGLAWPLLVTLTPAADRPWISRHLGQQHLVADLQLQRRRPDRRPDRRARRPGSAVAVAAAARSAAPPASSACCRLGPGRPGRLAARLRRRGRAGRARAPRGCAAAIRAPAG